MKQKEGAEKAIWLVLDFDEGWAMQETQFRSLGWEDCLEKGMATNCNILTWRIPWTEETDGLQSMGLQRVGHDCEINTFTLVKGVGK